MLLTIIMSAPNTQPRAEFSTVTEYLGWDHDRLDALLSEVRRMAGDGELERASATYAEFLAGLERHIRLEEDVLFPLFEQHTGMAMGPTEVMRREHRVIERALEAMREGLAGGRPAGFEEGHDLLQRALPDHNTKEEHVLYPMIDRLLDDRARLALVARLEHS